MAGVRITGWNLPASILLAQSRTKGPSLALLLGLKVEPAEQLDRRIQYADLLPLRARHHADGTHQLVFSGQTAVKKWNDEFFRTARERQPQKNLVRATGALFVCGNALRPDVVAFLRLARRRRLLRCCHASRVDRLAAHGVEIGHLPPQAVRRVQGP